MIKKQKILLSFVGSKDAGPLDNKPDGPILTALQNEKFDQAYLLWNNGTYQTITYKEIVEYLKSEIVERKLVKKVFSCELPIKNVIDHNSIYTLLKEFTENLDKTKKNFYTAAISSGTPAMSVCWILLAESGDFSESNPLRLIQVGHPKFGKSENLLVKIDTSLPRIVRLKEEVKSLKKNLIPVATIKISRPSLTIGNNEIPVTAIELCYFTYFARRVVAGKGQEKFPLYHTTSEFLDNIIEIHKELFIDSDYGRQDLERIRKQNVGLDIKTFRGNISKLNRKIREAISNDSIAEEFIIVSGGIKGAKSYGIKAPKDKIKIIK